MKTPEDDHFCCSSCEKAQKPCALCLAQRSKLREDRLRAEQKPTMTYNPFARLLK